MMNRKKPKLRGAWIITEDDNDNSSNITITEYKDSIHGMLLQVHDVGNDSNVYLNKEQAKLLISVLEAWSA